jgi:predicted site-specific integrase-resolvase
MSEKVFMDQKELAERWIISPRTLERWRWSGEGPKVTKVGGRCLYRITEVEKFELEGENKP